MTTFSNTLIYKYQPEFKTMINRFLKVSFTFLLVFFTNNVCYSQIDKLPSEVKQYLDKNYNDWQLVEAPYYDSTGIIQGSDQKEGRNFTSGDYDDNGEEDYAIMLEHQNRPNQERKQIETFVMMTFEGKFEEYDLGGGCRYDCIIDTMPAGYKVKEVYTDKTFKLDNPGIVVAFIGKASSAYYYSEGKFKSINTGD